MQDKLAFIARCFAFADQDQRGYLKGHDLKCGVAAALGIRPSKLLLSQLFLNVAGKDGGGDLRVSLDVFTKVIAARLSKPELLEDVRRLFKAMDLRAEGFISLQSFQKNCGMALPLASQETVLRAFREADRDGDGRVTYQDFERLCLLALQVTCDTNYIQS